MVTTTRIQKRYDHRLRELVRTTRDMHFALQHGVPRSTARGWLTGATVDVVSTDVLNMDVASLQQEVIRLRTRVQKLIALLRILLAVLKVSKFSLNHGRLPDGKDKRLLLRAIERARTILPLRSVLPFIRLSPSRYHVWSRKDECKLDDVPSCPRNSPHQLTDSEIETIRDLVTSHEYRHVPTGTLAILAQRIGKVYASVTTWYRLARDHQWLYLKSLDTVATVCKLVAFYVEQHNGQLPHSAFQGQTPDEMYFRTGDEIPKILEAARQKVRQARADANRQRDCEACRLPAASLN